MVRVAPILNRELIAFLRGRRAFWCLAGFLVLTGMVTVFAYVRLLESGPAMGRDAVSRGLFLACSYSQLVLFALLSMMMTSNAVSGERHAHTFDLLVTTPLRAREILVGKALASVGYMLLLITATIPVYSLCFLLGGVGWREIVSQVYITLLMAVTYGVIGVATSAAPKRKATRQHGDALFVVLLLNGGIALAVFLAGLAIRERFGWPDGDAVAALSQTLWVLLSPVMMFTVWTNPFFGGSVGPWTPEQLLIGHSGAQAALCLFYIRLGCRGMRKEVRVLRKKPRRFRLWLPGLFPIPDFVNPVAAKDILAAFPKGKLASIALALILAVLFALGTWRLIALRQIMPPRHAALAFDIAATIVVGALAVLVFFRSSGVVAVERDGRTYGLLHALPMRPFSVMFGKLAAVGVSIAGVAFLLGMGLTLIFCVLYPMAIPHIALSIPLILISLVASCAMYGAIGVQISAAAKTVRSAANRVGALLIIVFFVVMPCLGGCLGSTIFERDEAVKTLFGNGLLALFFPAPLALLREDLPGNGEAVWWVFFLLGIGLSLGIAWVFLSWAARSYSRRMWKDGERAGSK